MFVPTYYVEVRSVGMRFAAENLGSRLARLEALCSCEKAWLMSRAKERNAQPFVIFFFLALVVAAVQHMHELVW